MEGVGGRKGICMKGKQCVKTWNESSQECSHHVLQHELRKNGNRAAEDVEDTEEG